MRRSIQEKALEKLQWVETEAELLKAAQMISKETIIALDVETKMYSGELCLIQVGIASTIFLIDPLMIGYEAITLHLNPIFSEPTQQILIHNASFERRILGQIGIELSNVIDTLKLSREIRGKKIDGGHSLKSVCLRELNLHISKDCQTSDWSVRPLSKAQILYAAMDAEVLLELYLAFKTTSSTELLF